MSEIKETKPKKQLPQLAKGMRDIVDEQYYERQGFFEKAQEISMYYGFDPIETPILEQEEVFLKTIGEGTDVIDKELYQVKAKGDSRLVVRPEYTASVMRAYLEHGMRSKSQPVMMYYFGPVFRHDKPQKGRYREFYQFGLEAIGSDKPIADALIIQTTCKIIEESGCENIVVEINSIGDKESRAQYEKALKAYYKKFIEDLPAIDRERLKTNPLRILDSKEAKTITINEDAPDAISHLTNSSKKHFKQVLEHLDELGINYRINKNLVRGLDYYSDTVFEIVEEITDEEGKTRSLSICGGGRYNYLAQSLGYNKSVPAVGVGIGVERVMESSWWKKLTPRIIKDPTIYFIQLGFEAKLKALSIVEILRKAKVPILQSISKDKLSTQLAMAEKSNAHLVILFGQREAIDNTVMVRDLRSQSQKTVKIADLVAYLKEIK
jgi:histidyl-tRNA synthetase